MTELTDLTTRRPHAITSARRAAAWADRSTYGRVTVKGADRLDLLHRLTTNDLTGRKSGDGRQTVLLTEKARIIDVITDRIRRVIQTFSGLFRRTFLHAAR